MLLMVERYIKGGICQTIYQYAKGENKCMKNYDKKKKNRHILNTGMEIIFQLSNVTKAGIKINQKS